ncbi:hypothetical protein [Legionella hackeliae]|uniref:Uncharacterized protein n=1 Tax=Legionella hackeliae TaxID=449 RepID=A0A0A8UML0_LEGHA|nr:hypothetical protein [Legionella hackeliae]KTD10580.1 hypothetical protein Lhac_2948 [Legionella hackeliae]CEK10085.1 protein of unknown function [Legionella hackeliae]STX46809.1 Uncharacterised protein [Legionella hackeliae]
MYSKEEPSEEDILRATKTGMGSLPSPFNPPWSIVCHSNYRSDANKDNVAVLLKKDTSLQGILFRPSSTKGYTTVSILLPDGRANNLMLSNVELNKLEISYKYYKLHLANSIFEIIQASADKATAPLFKALDTELHQRIADAKAEIEAPQRELAARFKMD